MSAKECPNCGHRGLSGGVLLDTVTGQRGYGCPECDYAFTVGEVRRAN